MHILFDLGKTKLRIAGSHFLDSFVEPRIFDTPKNYEDTLSLIAKTAREIAGAVSIDSVGGGLGGPLEKNKKALVEAIVEANKVEYTRAQFEQEQLGFTSHSLGETHYVG